MSYPPFGTAQIKCAKRGCNWTGKETERKSVPIHQKKGYTKQVCPRCGCDSYYFLASPKEQQ